MKMKKGEMKTLKLFLTRQVEVPAWFLISFVVMAVVAIDDIILAVDALALGAIISLVQFLRESWKANRGHDN